MLHSPKRQRRHRKNRLFRIRSMMCRAERSRRRRRSAIEMKMTTKIIPPAFITQSEEAYDKGYDPKVARGLLRFLKPYTGQMLFALFLMIIVTVAAVSG